VNSDNDLLHEPYSTQQKSTNSFQPLKLLIFLTIILFIALLVGLGGYLLGRVANQRHYQPTPTSLQSSIHTSFVSLSPKDMQPAPPKSTITLGQTSDTAYWNTYYDAVGRFEFKYPENWNQVVLTQNIGIALTPEHLSEASKYLSEVWGGLPGVTVYTDTIKNCSNSKENIPNSDYPSVTIRPLKVSNMDGFLVAGLPGPGEPIGQEVFIFHCPTMIELAFDPTGIENGEQIFQQILSTLKLWAIQTPTR
jgi:hypothetical protein